MENNPNELLINLGRRIEELRKFRGMTQVQLAAEAKIARPYLCEIQQGKRNPSVGVLNQIAVALGVSPAALLIDESLVVQETTTLCIPTVSK